MKEELVSGAFNTPTLQQNNRLTALREKIRGNRKAYEKLLPPDPNQRKDKDGNLYFGSHQHFTETLLVYLEQIVKAVEKVRT